MYESEEAYQKAMANERTALTVGIVICAVGSIVWLVLGLINRDKAKVRQEHARRQWMEYWDALYHKLDNPPELLADALHAQSEVPAGVLTLTASYAIHPIEIMIDHE